MRTLVLCCLIAFSLVGCKKSHDLRPDVPKNILAIGDWHIDTLKNGDMEANKKYLAPSQFEKEAQENLAALSKILQAKGLVSNKNYEVVYYHTHGIMDGRRYNITYQLQFKDYWLLVSMGIDHIGQWRGVINTSYQPIPRPVQELNAFNFKNKTWRHYLVLAVFLLIISVVCYALWKWWRTSMPIGWKVFWLIVIFIGFGRFIFDWNYNRYAMQWVTVREVPVFVGKRSHNGWWYFTLSFPAGAAVFLFLERRWRMAEKKQEDSPTAQS